MSQSSPLPAMSTSCSPRLPMSVGSAFLFVAWGLCLGAFGCHSAPVAVSAPKDRATIADVLLPVRLPTLDFLALGMAQRQTLDLLRARGYACNDGAAISQTLACLGPVVKSGSDGQAGSAVLLEFDPPGSAGAASARLNGVQLQPASSGIADVGLAPAVGGLHGGTVRSQFDALRADWRRAFGSPAEIRRPGITALRHVLQDGSALVMVYYEEGEADGKRSADASAMTLEQVRHR